MCGSKIGSHTTSKFLRYRSLMLLLRIFHSWVIHCNTTKHVYLQLDICWYIFLSWALYLTLGITLFLGDPVFTCFWFGRLYLTVNLYVPSVPLCSFFPTGRVRMEGFPTVPAGCSLRAFPSCELSDGHWVGISCWRPSHIPNTHMVSLLYGFANAI